MDFAEQPSIRERQLNSDERRDHYRHLGDPAEKNKKATIVKTIKGNKQFKWTKSKLKKKTPYKVQVKAWVNQDGKKVYVKKSPAVYAYVSGGNKIYTNAKNGISKKIKVTVG